MGEVHKSIFEKMECVVFIKLIACNLCTPFLTDGLRIHSLYKDGDNVVREILIRLVCLRPSSSEWLPNHVSHYSLIH